MIEEVTTSASLRCNLVAAITVINTLNHHISSSLTAIIMPEKWELVSWQKKDEQASRIPKGWLLSSTNYIEVPRKNSRLQRSTTQLHWPTRSQIVA